MIDIGQGLLLKLDFADGGVCRSPRTFLVVEKNNEEIKLVNISSTNGKEWKLAMQSNKNIELYNPPFKIRSFAKLDAIYVIPNESCLREALLANGRRINPTEIESINIARLNYRDGIGNIVERKFSLDEVRRLNSKIDRAYAMAT